MADSHGSTTDSAADALVGPTIELVRSWIVRASELETRQDRATMSQLRELINDDAGVKFVMQFIDRVARPDNNRVAARQLQSIVRSGRLPEFLSGIDRLLLRIGAQLAPSLPPIAIPLARRRMRSIVGHLVASAEPDKLAAHLARQSASGYNLNVNLLGEAVLGEREAESRFASLVEIMQQPDVDYVSVKLSAVVSQLNHWAHDDSLARVKARAAHLLDAAATVEPATFVNFDMEEYHDLELTVDAFIAALSEPNRTAMDAGLVLQAYLPDAFGALVRVVEWANARHAAGGGTIKVRLVKGANLAMEQVDAVMHGWEQAPYGSKVEVDANYRRCLDWVLHENRLGGVRVGVASHNLFDIAWTKLLAEQRGVGDKIQFEMLQGMAPGQAKAVNEAGRATNASPLLLYTPAVKMADFDVAIGYLFRRLEENAAPQNFMRALFDLAPDSQTFREQADFFAEGVTLRHTVSTFPRRTQDRRADVKPWPEDRAFQNEPDTDPNLDANRSWIKAVSEMNYLDCSAQMLDDINDVDEAVRAARAGQAEWSSLAATERRRLLLRAGDELGTRRGELINAMMHEASKTFSEADVEVSEAIDFARWYANAALDIQGVERASFQPYGVVAVVPPWNFPTAIPAGGVLASLAAGNSVVFKPAPQTPRCAELVAEALWAAGVPRSVLQFVRLPDNEIGRRLIELADAVILTGSSETADLFRSWRPDLRLFAETSGKNALIITPSADIDLAVHDLVHSAFRHGGQKCSAASIAILVGGIAESERFRRQLVDATQSLTLGPSTDLGTDIAPLIDGGNERLARAVAHLEPGQRWLVEPTVKGPAISPGIIDGVQPNSWFHRTECFGPVLGLMFAKDLSSAIELANSSDFGLTGGIHTLDPAEIELWQSTIEVGNGYVNRPITGAIVRRQPFGGWKRSSVGPGAKAGGPNYVVQLGTWHDTGTSEADDDYQHWWDTHFSQVHDESQLFCEANVFRYRPLPLIGLRIAAPDSRAEELVRRAASIAGVPTVESDVGAETDADFIARMHSAGVERVRLVGGPATQELFELARDASIHLADDAVTTSGRIELQHFVREQAMSMTLHRFGNLVADLAVASSV